MLTDHGWTFNSRHEPDRLGAIESGIASAELSRLDRKVPEQKIAKEFFDLYAEDVRYALTAISEHLGNDTVESVSAIYEKTKRLSPLKMTSTLSEHDWADIVNRFYGLKREHVETLIKLFEEPERYRTPDNSETVRERFIKIVEKLA